MSVRRLIDGDFQRDIALPDGTLVRVRLLRPSDKGRLADAIAKLSPESRYYRFLSATTTLSDNALNYLSAVDNEDHLAIVAGKPTDSEDEQEGWGLARFVRQAPGGNVAEAAVTVLDDYQGRGLGRLLLAAITLAARERGVERFEAEILASNAPVLGLLRHLGATVNAHADAGVVHIDLALPPLPQDGKLEHLPDGPGSQLIRFAAKELKLLSS
ncbi:MAG: GNAT family N-acetyltransferase [Deltaproteobacteria bacterium]|nr:GNAT family N-acetyltransferase [Deltaproteobacteria bacterium]